MFLVCSKTFSDKPFIIIMIVCQIGANDILLHVELCLLITKFRTNLPTTLSKIVVDITYRHSDQTGVLRHGG